MEFLYDHTGVFALRYNGSTYFYRKNAQNDIIALLDSNGSVVVKYMYDAWGNCNTTVIASSASTIAELNPFRYRSYYYDVETGFYFLKTRYYDPEIGRFMTIDDISYLDPDSINGLNLYAYCGNNPIMYYDPIGNALLTIGLILLATTIIGGIAGGVISYDQGYRGWDVIAHTALGAGIGLAIGGASIAITAVAAGAIAAISGTISATVFGVPVLQAFAIGALAFDTFAYILAPLYGIIDMQGIEYEHTTPYKPPSYYSNYPNHPALK